MNNILKRILVGVCIALVMMVVHKVARADPVSYRPWADGYGHTASSGTGLCSLVQPTSSFVSGGIMVGGQMTGNCIGPGISLGVYSAPYCADGSNVQNNSSSGGDGKTVWCGVYTPPAANCTAGQQTKFTTKWGHTGNPSNPPLPKSDGICNTTGSPDATQCYTKPQSADPTITYCDWVDTQTGTSSPQSDAFSPPIGGPTLPAIPTYQGNPGGSCGGGMSNVGTDSTGSPICAATGTNPAVPDKTTGTGPTTTTTNPDGSTTTTGSTSNSNADGSTTTNTTSCTTGADGGKSCTTSQSTGNTPAGGAGKSDGKPDDPKDLCALHPELNVCKNAQVQGGNCSGGADDTSCTGDAIACAMLRQQRLEWCANSQATRETTLGTQLMGGQDPQGSSLPTPSNGQTIALGSLDQSGFLGGGGTCFADKSYTLMGVTSALPFSQVCPYLLPLRYGIMVVAALVSLAVMRKSILG